MSSHRIKRAGIVQLLALAIVALALALASQVAAGKQAKPGPPAVLTGAVTHATGTSAVLNGSVDPRGFATSYHFEYGPSDALTEQTSPISLPAGTTTVKVAQTVSGFQAGYHYRLVASNQEGTKLGHERVYSPKSQTKKNAFVLPKTFAATPVGGEFVLSGTLTGSSNAGRAIVLQASPYPYVTAFATVGRSIVTSTGGAFTFRVADLRTSTKLRVSTVGTPTVISPVVPAQAQVRVVMKVRSSSHKGLYRLFGTVTPTEPGAHVFIQLEKAAKAAKPETGEKPAKLEKAGKGASEKPEKPPTFTTEFKTLVKRATSTISRFSVVVNVASTGNYRAFVELPPGPVVSGHSEAAVLHAPAKKQKQKQS